MLNANKYVGGDWPFSTHADPTSTRRAIFHERRISSGSIYSLVRAQADLSATLGFWESKVHKNGRFPAQDADDPPGKIWRRYLYHRRRNP